MRTHVWIPTPIPLTHTNGKQQPQGFLWKLAWLSADFSQAPPLSPRGQQSQEDGGFTQAIGKCPCCNVWHLTRAQPLGFPP